MRKRFAPQTFETYACSMVHTFLLEQYINFPAQQCSEISRIYSFIPFPLEILMKRKIERSVVKF